MTEPTDYSFEYIVSWTLKEIDKECRSRESDIITLVVSTEADCPTPRDQRRALSHLENKAVIKVLNDDKVRVNMGLLKEYLEEYRDVPKERLREHFDFSTSHYIDFDGLYLGDTKMVMSPGDLDTIVAELVFNNRPEKVSWAAVIAKHDGIDELDVTTPQKKRVQDAVRRLNKKIRDYIHLGYDPVVISGEYIQVM